MNYDAVKMNMVEDVARKYGMENFVTVMFSVATNETDDIREIQLLYQQIMEARF